MKDRIIMAKYLRELIRAIYNSFKVKCYPLKIVNNLLLIRWLNYYLVLPCTLRDYVSVTYNLWTVMTDYRSLPTDGRIILDVGAFIGDSALFFAARGARKIIAVEPLPHHFFFLKLNTLLNREERKILALKAAIGKKPRCRKALKLAPGASYNDHGFELNVPIYSLLELVEITYPNVVKIDCEGCEYFIREELAKLKGLGIEALALELHDKPGLDKAGLLHYVATRLGAKPIISGFRGGTMTVVFVLRGC